MKTRVKHIGTPLERAIRRLVAQIRAGQWNGLGQLADDVESELEKAEAELATERQESPAVPSASSEHGD